MTRLFRDAAETVAVAFSMFSAVPMPQFEWNRRNMRFMLCAFPLIGALTGALMWGWAALCARFAVPQLLKGLLLCLIPAVVTGGIHIDGFCDTWDALASRGDAQKMRAILKDPHIGSFAAIHLVSLLLSRFVLWAVMPKFRAVPVLFSFVLSRSLSALAVAAFPIAEGAGLARTFAETADRKRCAAVSGITSAAAAAAMILTGGWSMVLAAAAVFLIYRAVIVRRFHGLTGDLAGWFVETAELCMCAALFAAEFFGGV